MLKLVLCIKTEGFCEKFYEDFCEKFCEGFCERFCESFFVKIYWGGNDYGNDDDPKNTGSPCRA